MSSTDGWSTAVNKRSRNNKKSKPDGKFAEDETIQEPNQDLLDPIFQNQDDEEDSMENENQKSDENLNIKDNEEDGFVTVTHKRKKTKKSLPKVSVGTDATQNQQKKKRKRRTKKKKSQRILAEEDDAKDEMRARMDLEKGCPVEFYSTFSDNWIKAVVISSYDDEITLEYYSTADPDMPRTGVFKRTAEEIRPLKDKKTGFYYPMPPEEEEIVVKERKQPKKKKSRKSTKNAVKKVSTEEEIHALIDELLTNQGPSMGMTEIANTIKDNLNGGSWGKRYKGKFGSMKKFLSAQENFEVYEDQGQIMVRRLQPEPEPIEESTKSRAPKGNSSSGSSPMLYLLLIILLPAVCAGIFLQDDSRRQEACAKLAEILGDNIKHLDVLCKK